jgi:hypothetical protein
MQTAVEYHVPQVTLNTPSGEPIPYFDEVHPIPNRWLEANVKRFHFTDQQITEAAKPQFEGDWCSIERWCDYPGVCGIYFLVAGKRIVYVGLSNRIPRRIFQHRDNGVEFDSLTWFEAPEFYMKAIEAYYIERIDPPFNTARPRDNEFSRIAKLLDAVACETT